MKKSIKTTIFATQIALNCAISCDGEFVIGKDATDRV